MKLRIYEPGKTYLEGEVVVRLREDDTGDSIVLQVMEGRHSTWHLLRLYPEGVRRAEGMGESAGFPLDAKGRLVDLSDSPGRP